MSLLKEYQQERQENEEKAKEKKKLKNKVRNFENAMDREIVNYLKMKNLFKNKHAYRIDVVISRNSMNKAISKFIEINKEFKEFN